MRDANTRPRSSTGMTLLELLVVIGVVGLLLSLAAPALQSARERSRALKCAANLRQIGMALHQYHESMGQLPMGRIRGGDPWFSQISHPMHGITGRSVHTALLPFLEAGECYALFNFEVPGFHAAENMTAELCRPSAFVCPSDSGTADRIGNPGSHVPYSDPPGGAWPVRLTQYGAMYGSIHFPNFHPSLPGSDPHNERNGCFTERLRIRFSDVHDGLASTIFFSERALSVQNPEGGALVLGRWTNTFDFGTLINGGIPPNYARAVPPDSVRWTANVICSAYSDHPGGVYVLMGDGSARFVDENIDSWPLSDEGLPPCLGNGLPCTAKPGVWQALCTRSGDD